MSTNDSRTSGSARRRARAIARRENVARIAADWAETRAILADPDAMAAIAEAQDEASA